ncbi:MAG TPA: methyltransferase domain-containing protein [Bryobacteraceae bacterium]|nr:methyltransferase domain-containing protein [Bryobacteraceae bacterium]
MTDQWDSSLYDDRHSFVWKKSADLIELLALQPGERILDLGCGTGHLTASIAERGAEVIGLDSSPSMVAQARQNYPKLKFVLADARDFRFEAPFDAVFSNAALHWMPEAERVIESIARALKPGGRFVLEMGGKGNIARLTSAIEYVLREMGKPVHNPWFFPSLGEYATLLERHGFEVAYGSTFDRWNRLEHPERGLREWLEMFAGSWFQGLSAEDRIAGYRDIENRLRGGLWCDGAWWADYKRLRVSAHTGK